MPKPLDILEDAQLIALAISDASVLMSAQQDISVGANLLHVLANDLTKTLISLDEAIRN